MEKSLNTCDKSVIYWNSYLRKVCVMLIKKTAFGKKIRGLNKTIGINESLFFKHKNNFGRTQQWTFLDIYRKIKECFMIKVLERTTTT